MTKRTIDSPLSMAIMGLLFYIPMSGYDLRKAFSATSLKHFSSSPGAIYPALRRIEAAALIQGKIERQNTLRPRKVYTLTSVGMAAFKERLSQSVTLDDIMWRMDELMLRFSFMYELLGKERTLKFLEEFSSATGSHIQALEKEYKLMNKNVSFGGPRAFEHGIEVYRSTVHWAKKVIREIQKKGELK
ncbi:MAG: helix-turn-helix transcriptional regulator [Candidatus Aminicenantes bacterium]|nr:helix-turn-helix transcriptional regulator [Candidatus Aminicenantes bacterium]